MMRRISRNVFFLGWVSFFNDIASEMIYPLIPIFLTSSLQVPVSIVGLIEGIAEATVSIFRVFSGWISDKVGRRKIFVVSGYFTSAISKLILSIANSWIIVLIARFMDRLGKGIRTPARDALIVDSSSLSVRASSFGFHRALDTAGAVIGPLLALLALRFMKKDFHPVFLLAGLFSFLGIFFLSFVKENRKYVSKNSTIKLTFHNFSPAFKTFIFATIIFSLGNSSDVFLILRAKNLGLSIFEVIGVYVVFNFTYALFSFPAGIISDKVGPKKIIITGFLIFSLIYFSFGFISNNIFLWILFPIYGIYMALTNGVSKAYISLLVPQKKSATALGLYQTVVGVCTLFSSLIAGILWSYIGISVPFILGGITALLSTCVLLFFLK